jgi:hypothetical protein
MKCTTNLFQVLKNYVTEERFIIQSSLVQLLHTMWNYGQSLHTGWHLLCDSINHAAHATYLSNPFKTCLGFEDQHFQHHLYLSKNHVPVCIRYTVIQNKTGT